MGPKKSSKKQSSFIPVQEFVDKFSEAFEEILREILTAYETCHENNKAQEFRAKLKKLALEVTYINSHFRSWIPTNMVLCRLNYIAA